MAKSLFSFFIVDLKNYDTAEKAIHYIQVNQVIEEPRMKSTKADEKMMKAEFNFMIDLKTMIHKTSVDPETLQVKICVRKKQKERASEKFSSVFS